MEWKLNQKNLKVNWIFYIIYENLITTPLLHFIKPKLSELEKSHYYSLIDEFENDLVSQYEISTLLYSWALRCNLKIIIEQSLFNPFPKNLLLDLVESKKEYSIL